MFPAIWLHVPCLSFSLKQCMPGEMLCKRPSCTKLCCCRSACRLDEELIQREAKHMGSKQFGMCYHNDSGMASVGTLLRIDTHVHLPDGRLFVVNQGESEHSALKGLKMQTLMRGFRSHLGCSYACHLLGHCVMWHSLPQVFGFRCCSSGLASDPCSPRQDAL